MTMNNGNSHSGNGFASGLLWGLIIGGALALLFSTKKGRKILKAITEGGLEGVADLEDLLEEVSGQDEYEKPVIKKKVHPVSVPPANSEEATTESSENGQASESTISRIKSTGKRFFRGVPRRN